MSFNVTELDAQRKKIWIILAIVLAVLFLGIIIGVVSFAKAFAPVPINERNYSTSNTTMFVDVAGDERRTIVQSYTSEEFESMRLDEKNAVRDFVAGNLEGDIPCVSLSRNPVIRIVLQSSDKTGKKADKVPAFRLVCYTNAAMLPKSNEKYEDLIDEGVKTECWENNLDSDEQGYLIDMNKLSGIEKLKTNEEALLCSCYIEVRYCIDGQEYISITAFSLVD